MSMNMTAEMMDSMAGEMAGSPLLDMMTVQQCIEACSACEQACVICSDAGMADGMVRCMSMCASCADLCNTTMRMLMRQTGFDAMSMMSTLEACMTMCSACADECRNHARMSETCRMCAQACQQCADACKAMLGVLNASMT
jgi:hypothetical protein